MKTILMCTLLFLAGLGISYAQNITVKGNIKDQSGTNLPDVNILVKGTTNGVVSDISGNFSIKVSSGAVLVFSSIGYDTKEVKPEGRTEINVVLQSQFVDMGEVVVTALGIKREKKSLGYSMQEINSEELSENKDVNFINSLNSKVAGVQINKSNSGAGSTTRIVIRGENSLANDNQPLFVVDGVPINNYTTPSVTTSSSSGAQEVDYGNGAGDINPDDISSVSVLKGANAAALYGSRAANGVILITTKSGKSQKKGIGVSVNSSVTFEDFLVMPKFQNLFGQGSKGKYSFVDGLGNGLEDGVDESWGPAFSEFDKLPQFDSPSTDVNGNPVRAGDIKSRITGYDASGKPIYTSVTPTEWRAYNDNVKDFFETGITQSHNIAITGANDKGNFRLSFTNLDNDDIIPNVDLKRNTLSLNTGYNFTPKLSVKASTSYINSKSGNRPSNGYGPENPMYLFAWYGRSINTASFKSNYWQKGQEGKEQFTYNIWHENPYFNMYENTNSFNKNRFLGNIVLNYQITDKLNLMARTGIDWFADNRESKRAYSSKRFPKGMFREDNVFFKEQNSDILLTYSTILTTDINLSVSLGANHMSQKNNFTSVIANELSIPAVYTLANSSVPLVASQYDTEKEINSIYGLANISYKDMLFLELTSRNDWSSTLPEDNNSYFYPSVSLSGVISEMVQLPEIIDFAKFRLGYAEVGNDTEPYRLRSIYKYTTPYGSNYGLTDDNTIANADLKPEKQQSYEIGADISLFKGRIGLDITYYDNKNKNQIIKLPIAAASGYNFRYVNAGEIRNFGIEAMLNLQPVKTKDFVWDLSLNYSKNDNEVVSISEGMEKYVYNFSTPYSSDGAMVYAIAKKGGKLGEMYGTGFKKVEVDGKTRTVYEAGLPVQDSELRKLGNYNPDFILGISNSFRYKNFKMNVVFDWRSGGEIVSRFYSIASRTGVLDHTLLGRAPKADGTFEDGVVGDGVKWDASANKYVENDVKVSSQTYHKATYRRVNEESAVFDASFVKLREVSLSYTMPKKWLNKLPINDLTFSIIGRNLALWTEQDYVDPETGSYENEKFMPGVEEMSYPSTRSIGFNVSFKF